jgi:hypothetical protein
MYLRKTVDYIKNNIDSYFKIENNFKNYVENVHTRAWPDKKPTGKQLVDMNDASERLKEMRRIYKERIYELSNNIINNEKTLFDMKQGEYESQDTTVLQNKIIRTVELNLTDRPFRKGGKGVPDIQPIKGDVTKLNELAANIKKIYLTYPNNKTLEKYIQSRRFINSRTWDWPSDAEKQSEETENSEIAKKDAEFAISMLKRTNRIFIEPAPFRPVLLCLDNRIPKFTLSLKHLK